MENSEKYNLQIDNRRNLDKILEKTRIEADILNSYEEALVMLQDEYYEGEKALRREGKEFVISAKDLWNIIEDAVSKRVGNQYLDKYSIAVYSLMTKDLNLLVSINNRDIAKREG